MPRSQGPCELPLPAHGPEATSWASRGPQPLVLPLVVPGWALQAASVFVKNLNFATTESELRSHFSIRLGDAAVRSVVVSLGLRPTWAERPRMVRSLWHKSQTVLARSGSFESPLYIQALLPRSATPEPRHRVL